MTSLVKGVVIVAAKRTPFGRYGGKFVKTSAAELQIVAAKAALAAGNVKPELIDSVIVGNVRLQSSPEGGLIPRHVALKSGIPQDRTAVLINRLCGSGFQSIVNAAQEIQTGMSQICLTGGTENMSQCPYIGRNLRFGVPLGQNVVLEDSLWLGFTDTYAKMPMALTAEKLGAQFKLTKEEVDAFALRSQQTWKNAHDGGRFSEELTPVTIEGKKGAVVVDVDEHPRPETTLDGLKKLPTLFKENGLVTAGSASGISDGAAAVVVANEEAVSRHDLTPLARVVAFSVVGVDPTIMGIGPVPAIKNVLKATGKSLDDIDLVEINEAFGAQALACVKGLDLDINKLNVDGGV
ncbi:hypothetical protein Zmor_027359 [Zophobas morio]|uniref:3-ketoacyl-CoA thiolase, mitochondrial n=1 Tax=Zophobas morio TaxID=2755281 RepID=A0AA38M207_9CUCU|nr:hypothetical protein Zmor_027359 [Zophobas morio]